MPKSRVYLINMRNNTIPVECYYWKKYYPKNKFNASSISSSDEQFRRLMWRFKDGIDQQMNIRIAEHFGVYIKKTLPLEDDTVLMIIPASTQSKTNLRFNLFSQKLSEVLNIPYVQGIATRDHDPEKGRLHSDKARHFKFNSNLFRGKSVILVDDILTTGTTFTSTTKRLLVHGAKKVVGFMVAKTQSL